MITLRARIEVLRDRMGRLGYVGFTNELQKLLDEEVNHKCAGCEHHRGCAGGWCYWAPAHGRGGPCAVLARNKCPIGRWGK
jgi:hypothetical protein